MQWLKPRRSWSEGLKKLIENARWMDGFVWFVVMTFIWLVYETQFRGVPLTGGLIAYVVVVWALASIGFAILSGYFAEKFRTNREE